MNVILLDKNNFLDQTTACLNARQYKHLTSVLKLTEGDCCRVGVIDGSLGEGKIIQIDSNKKQVTLKVTLSHEPPQQMNVQLVVALPRPLMFKRILFSATMMGVKKILFINTKKVEKTFWDSHSLLPEQIREQLILGLEQAVDTKLPKIEFCRSFKNFISDHLPSYIKFGPIYVGEQKGEEKSLSNILQPCTFLIGPEGGLNDFECDELKKSGCEFVSLGNRTLRVEHAVTVFLARCL